MHYEVDIIRAEISDVESMMEDECWLEGERRGQPVDPHDPAVQLRVAEIILSGAGASLRRKYLSKMR
jgi:hypothetical protein